MWLIGWAIVVGCLGEEDGGRGEGGEEMLCEKNLCIPASGFQASAPTCIKVVYENEVSDKFSGFMIFFLFNIYFFPVFVWGCSSISNMIISQTKILRKQIKENALLDVPLGTI